MQGRRNSAPLKMIGSWNGLFVIADATAQIANPGYEAHLRHRLWVGTRPWKHVADLSDLTFRLLRRGIEFQADRRGGFEVIRDEGLFAPMAPPQSWRSRTRPSVTIIKILRDPWARAGRLGRIFQGSSLNIVT